MEEEQKLFSYMELKAMCLVCAAYSSLYVSVAKLTDPVEGRKEIESEVEKIINIRWNNPSKK